MQTGRAATAWLAVWATVFAWLAGPGRTFAFLFYPFRELPALALTAWAVERACAGRRPSAGLAAGVLVLLVAAIRETLVPVALAGVLPGTWLRVEDRRGRGLRMAWTAGPLLLAFAAALLRAPEVNRQVSAVWTNLRMGLTPVDPREALAGLLRSTTAQVGLAGVLLSLAPLLFPATRRAAVLLPGMTAVAIIVHSLLSPHARYAVTCAAFLPAAAALGSAALPDRMRRPVIAVVLGLLVPAAFGFAAVQKPWGPRITRADVHETLRRVAASLTVGRPFYLEPGSRRLGACLMGYASTWPRGDAARPVAGGVYFEPFNEWAREDRATGPTLVPPAGVRLCRAGFNLVPATRSDGRVVPLKVAFGEFRICKVTPFISKKNSQQIDPEAPRVPSILWVDLLGLPAGRRTNLSVLDAGGRVLAGWELEGGRLHGVRLADPAACAAMDWVRLASDAPVPARFLHSVVPEGGALGLPPWMPLLVEPGRPVRGPGGWIETHGWSVEEWTVRPVEGVGRKAGADAWTVAESGEVEVRKPAEPFRVAADEKTGLFLSPGRTAGLSVKAAER
ncbi:MAG: hypothetical protein U1G05_14935 [Kiritimatiellia bacterium]